MVAKSKGGKFQKVSLKQVTKNIKEQERLKFEKVVEESKVWFLEACKYELDHLRPHGMHVADIKKMLELKNKTFDFQTRKEISDLTIEASNNVDHNRKKSEECLITLRDILGLKQPRLK